MCDHGGELGNRNSGRPKLYFPKGESIMIKQDYNPKNAKPGNKKMITTAGYFDAANFAKNIKCKTFIRAGGIDSACPPSSIFTAYNNIPSKNKEIIVAPLGNHCRGIYKDTKNIKLATFQNEKSVK